MRRVLPMIFICLGLVGYAVVHAHAAPADVYAQAIPSASPVWVETLTVQ